MSAFIVNRQMLQPITITRQYWEKINRVRLVNRQML